MEYVASIISKTAFPSIFYSSLLLFWSLHSGRLLLTAEIWCIVSLTAFFLLLQRKSFTFFNLQLLLLLSERVLSPESCLAICNPRVSCFKICCLEKKKCNHCIRISIMGNIYVMSTFMTAFASLIAYAQSE